jgi:hypothetical protein
MAEKELGKLSPEQVQKLAKTISEAKDLTSQQEETIQRVLAGEIELGNTRIASLERYFDTYSKNLDRIARKYSSLDDAFLVLGQKLNSEYKSLSSDVNELAHQLNSATEVATHSTGEKKQNQRTPKVSKADAESDFKTIAERALENLTKTYERESAANTKTTQNLNEKQRNLERSYQERRYAQLKQQLEQYTHKLHYSKETALTALRAQNDSVATTEGMSMALRNNMQEDTPEAKALPNSMLPLAELSGDTKAEVLKLFNEISAEEKAHKKVLKDIQAGKIADENEAWDSYFKNLSAAREAFAKQSISQEEKLNSELAKLSAKERANTLADNLKAQLELTNTKKGQTERGRARADTVNSQERLKSLQELEKSMAARRAELEDEKRAEHGGKLLKKDAIDIEKQLNSEFSKQLTNKKLNELTKERFDAESRAKELAKLREEDPALAAERDAHIAKKIAELELKYREENNYILDEQARKAIRKQVEEEFTGKSDAIGKLAEEYTEKMKVANAAAKLREEDPGLALKREEAMAKEKARLELAARRKNNGILTAEDNKRIKKQLEDKYATEGKEIEKLAKKKLKEDTKQQHKDDRHVVANALSSPLSKDYTIVDRFNDIKNVTEAKTENGSTGEKVVAWIDTATAAISDLVADLDDSINKIASYQGFIDTRLQGSSNKTNYAGSYWGQLTKDMMSVGAVTPFFRQEDFAENIKSLVNRGIAFDLKQRAFLMTIQEKIANTFDVADGTLLRLIRIQQEDSTAGRLGMESALNTFLNNMYETSEYLSDVAQSVRSSLEEMESLMSGAEATEVEFQVQKWMGSLYSVGMSSEAVNSIASALGQIAAGQVEALTNNSGAGNLMVMAANEAGLPISDILIKGLDAQETNQLLQATVNYLAELAESSKDNQVVQQQLANVFGVKASDLRAATNLSTNNTIKDVFSTYKTYDNMLKQLNDMAGSMIARTSIGEMMTNIWDNGMYSLASSMANDPIAYLTYKMSSLLEGATGGIPLPAISAAGFGVDLETTVADLMRVASLGKGIIGSLGDMIAGLGASFSGQAMLTKMGIEKGSGLQVTPRGTNDNSIALPSPGSGGNKTTSSSGYVGNASSSDIKSTTIQESEDTKEQLMVEAMEEERAHQIDFINENVLKIYELLDEVTSGKRNFSVKVAGYGLTSNTALSCAQGGVSGLLNNNSSGSGGNVLTGGLNNGSSNTSNSGVIGNTSSSSSGSTGGYSVNTGLDLGGWTMT